MQQSQLVIMTGMRRGELILVFEADAKSHCAEELEGSTVTGPVEIVHEITEAREDVLWEPLVGLVVVLLAADFVALLLRMSELVLLSKSKTTLMSETCRSSFLRLSTSSSSPMAFDTFSNPGQE